MTHEKCGNWLRYVTLYTVLTTKEVFEADPEEEATFFEVTNEELPRTTEVYCNICDRRLNIHEAGIVLNNRCVAVDPEEKTAIGDRWRRWQSKTDRVVNDR